MTLINRSWSPIFKLDLMFHGMYHCHKFVVNGNKASPAIMTTMKICDLVSLFFKLDLEYNINEINASRAIQIFFSSKSILDTNA